MSNKGRVTFTVRGEHPLLHFFRNYLIHKGFALVSGDEGPLDFVLVGGSRAWHHDRQDAPQLLLSSDQMYSDRDVKLDVREKKPMRENDAIVLPATVEPSITETLHYLMSENHYLTRQPKTMVLRIFNVYGPDIHGGLIYDMHNAAATQSPIQIYSPGYHTRTYLHQTDLLELFDKLVAAFLRGTTGIYNVGSSEEISIKRLADSVWQLVNGGDSTPETELIAGPRSYRWWVLPDLTRTKAVAKWKPKISLRTGLWELTQ